MHFVIKQSTYPPWCEGYYMFFFAQFKFYANFFKNFGKELEKGVFFHHLTPLL